MTALGSLTTSLVAKRKHKLTGLGVTARSLRWTVKNVNCINKKNYIKKLNALCATSPKSVTPFSNFFKIFLILLFILLLQSKIYRSMQWEYSNLQQSLHFTFRFYLTIRTGNILSSSRITYSNLHWVFARRWQPFADELRSKSYVLTCRG